MKTVHQIAVEMLSLLPSHVACEWSDKIRSARDHVEIHDPELCIPIPLIGGGAAELTIPRMMSHDNFLYLNNVIRETLSGMEEAITIEPEMPQELVDLDEEIKRLKEQNVALRREQDRIYDELKLHRSKAKNEYWAWQGGVEDYLESLVCPVLIPAAELRKLFESDRKLVEEITAPPPRQCPDALCLAVEEPDGTIPHTASCSTSKRDPQ